jgi:hypothetical protein
MHPVRCSGGGFVPPFHTARKSVLRVRPTRDGPEERLDEMAHSASVQSLAYRALQRAYCCRVVSVQAI